MEIGDLKTDPFINPSDIARMFGVKPYTVRVWIRDGKLKSEKINGRLKVRMSEVQKYAQQQFGEDEDVSDA